MPSGAGPSSGSCCWRTEPATPETIAPTREVRVCTHAPAWGLGPFVTPQLTRRTAFLAYLRLSVYMAIVAVAIVLSFHLRSEPSPLELKIAKPLGITFWALAVACLMVGLGNYIRPWPLSPHVNGPRS